MSQNEPQSTSPLVAFLSPLQRRMVAGALSALALVVLVGFILTLFWVMRLFVTTFSGILWPLAVAGIAALILRPIVLLFETKLGLTRVKSIILLYTIGALAVFGVLTLLLPLAISQIYDFAQQAPALLANAKTYIAAKSPEIIDLLKQYLSDEAIDELGTRITQSLQSYASLALPRVSTLKDWLTSAAGLATGLAVIPIYLFFFLMTDRDPMHDLKKELTFIRENWREDIAFLIREFAMSVVSFFRGQIIIGLIMGVLLATGFTIVGLRFGLLLGLFMGILNIIPYLGTIIGLGLALPIAFIQDGGGLSLAVMSLIVFVIVQIIEGYVLTPKIMGKSTGLHPLTIIIAIFFWGVALNGLLGMILAIPLTAFFVVLWRLISRKYLSRFTSGESQPVPNQ